MLPSVSLNQVIGIAAAVAVVAAGAFWFARDRPEPPPLEIPSASVTSGGSATVHVAGAVRGPGLVVVSEGARVADAIAAAGGASHDADLSALNLAAPVADGDRIVVPLIGQGAVVGADAGIDLNRAGAAELETMPGVGPVLAARIIAYREQNGPFTSVEDLLDVPGIGEAMDLMGRYGPIPSPAACVSPLGTRRRPTTRSCGVGRVPEAAPTNSASRLRP